MLGATSQSGVRLSRLLKKPVLAASAAASSCKGPPPSSLRRSHTPSLLLAGQQRVFDFQPRLPQTRFQSTLTTVKASSEAEREAPTPVVFVTATVLGDSPTRFKPYIDAFSENGFECLVVDINPDEATLPKNDSQKLLEALELDLASTLRNASPFPPTMITSHLTSLLGEQYASSHPLSALVLIDPPLSTNQAHSQNQHILPTNWPEYDFEATFPIVIAWTKPNAHVFRQGLHRIEEQQCIELLDTDRLVLEPDAPHKGEGHQLLTWLSAELGMQFESDEDNYLFRVDFEDPHGIEIDEDYEERELSMGEDEDEDEDARRPRSKPADISTWFNEDDYRWQARNKKMPLLIPHHHIREVFSRGGGKGGQAINKNMSRCDLTHIPTGTIVRCQETRSLDQNREIARRRLSRRVDEIIRGKDSVIRVAAAEEAQRKHKREYKAKRRVQEKEQQKNEPPTEKLSAKQKHALRAEAKEEKQRLKNKQREEQTERMRQRSGQ